MKVRPQFSLSTDAVGRLHWLARHSALVKDVHPYRRPSCYLEELIHSTFESAISELSEVEKSEALSDAL